MEGVTNGLANRKVHRGGISLLWDLKKEMPSAKEFLCVSFLTWEIVSRRKSLSNKIVGSPNKVNGLGIRTSKEVYRCQ